MRAVVDTKVVVSGILSARGAARATLDAARHGQFEFVTSPVLVEELRDVLTRFTETAAAIEITRALEELAEVVEPSSVPRVSRDPDDDHVGAAALAGSADVVVTRDEDLLVLTPYRGVRILSPADFLQALRPSA